MIFVQGLMLKNSDSRDTQDKEKTGHERQRSKTPRPGPPTPLVLVIPLVPRVVFLEPLLTHSTNQTGPSLFEESGLLNSFFPHTPFPQLSILRDCHLRSVIILDPDILVKKDYNEKWFSNLETFEIEGTDMSHSSWREGERPLPFDFTSTEHRDTSTIG